jgi:peptide/nickel transport system substrate-binding protein
MDPALIYDVETALVAQHVYRGLVRFATDSVEVEPDAAEFWDISEDGLTYTFRLREFSIERQTNPNHPAHVPGRMRYASFLFGDKSSTETALLDRVETPDSRTVVLHLTRPHGPFLRNLAMVPAAIVSPLSFAEKAATARMVGAGPYRMKTYRPNELVILEKNAGYIGDPPLTAELRFRVIRDATMRLAALRKGDADITGHLDPPAVAELKKQPEVVVMEEPSFSLNYISINHARAPFDKLKVRQAVALAVDKVSICERLYEGQGVPAGGIIPPGMLGYADLPVTTGPDPAAARKLLAEAGYPDGVDIVFTTQDRPRIYNPAGARLAEALQQQLEVAGFRVRLETTEFATFLNRLNARDYTIANSGWVTDNGDPDNFLFELVGREDNGKNYLNPEATRLMRQAASEPNEEIRASLYRDAEKLVAADVAVVPISYGKQVLAARRAVEGLKLHPTGCIQLQKVRVRQ